MTEIQLPETPYQLQLTLARRLAISAVLLGVTAGGVVYWLTSYRTESQALDRAIASVQHFQSPAMRLTTGGAQESHAALEQLLDKERFIGVRVFAPSRERLFERWGDIPEFLIAEVKRQSNPWPAIGHSHSKRIDVADEQLIQVVLPMTAEDGSLAGYVEGVSRVTAEALLGQQQQIQTAAIAGAASVLAATVLLYPLLLAMLKQSTGLSRRLLDSNLSLMHSLGNAVAKRDSDTDAHNYRVTYYAVALAEAMDLPEKEIADLVVGAFLHDVGKIGIPDRILLKPGKLTAEEFEVIKSHSLLGTEIVAGNHWLAGAAQTIRHHHERFDGTGYPDGLQGEAIPRIARVFAVVDVFDALTSERPYKQPMALAEALSVIEGDAGWHFDPVVVACFTGIAPGLYAKAVQVGDAELRQGMRKLLSRYFKAETAPEGAASRSEESVD